MQNQNTSPEIIQDAEFRKRRSQKNWIVLGLIMAGVALVWAVTMIRMQNGMEIAHPIGLSSVQEAPQKASEGDSHAQ
jgi:hypothetical protein